MSLQLYSSASCQTKHNRGIGIWYSSTQSHTGDVEYACEGGVLALGR